MVEVPKVVEVEKIVEKVEEVKYQEFMENKHKFLQSLSRQI